MEEGITAQTSESGLDSRWGDDMKEKITKEYISDDGKVFDNVQDCIKHEERVKKGGIFLYGMELTEERLRDYLWKGYWLTNYSPGKLDIFGPPPSNGCYGHIYGELAEKFGGIYDHHNYEIYERRKSKQIDAQ